MYIVVKDPWGSYVDGRPIEHRELVEVYAKEKGFTTQETDKEPVIDMLSSPIKAWSDARLQEPIDKTEQIEINLPVTKIKKRPLRNSEKIVNG